MIFYTYFNKWGKTEMMLVQAIEHMLHEREVAIFIGKPLTSFMVIDYYQKNWIMKNGKFHFKKLGRLLYVKIVW